MEKTPLEAEHCRSRSGGTGTGVCETNTRWRWRFHVLTPLPLFQSWRKDAQQQLTTMSVYFTDRLLVSVNIDIRGEGGSPTRMTSRTSVYFADTGMLQLCSSHNLLLLLHVKTSLFHFVKTLLSAVLEPCASDSRRATAEAGKTTTRPRSRQRLAQNTFTSNQITSP